MTSNDWRREVIATFDAIRARTDEREIDFDGSKIIVEPGVFAPDYFTDSIWYAHEVQRIVGNRSLLEIGTGTGIVALAAGITGAHGLATDINPAAVRNAQRNFERYNVPFEARLSDVYEHLCPSEQFDFILWNHPFNNVASPTSDPLFRAGFDENYAGLERYVAGARSHLSPRGRLLLGTGSGADQQQIATIARSHNYEPLMLAQTAMQLTAMSNIPNEYSLLELRRN